MMEKTFDPASIEARWAAAWETAGAFAAGRPDRAKAEPYCIVIPPPNVTGSLHMGHALNNTLQDILARFERMRGKDVLWQPGTDHAGIATQMVVERQLMERQLPGRREMGREAFVERIWQWKAESGGAIVNQLKRLGASCDWSRERFTMGRREDGESGQMQQAVIEFFVRLHEAGLIYKDKRLVNWDPKLLTAISDLEVEQIEVKGTFKWERGGEKPFDAVALGKILDRQPGGHLYYFDYPVVDSAGKDTGEIVTVATTRPETMLGDTGVAIHPENEKLKHLIGRNCRLPLVNRIISIVGDEYADPEKGTGAVKITPAHDFNDFEVGKRRGLKLVNIFTGLATIYFGARPGRPSNPDFDDIHERGADSDDVKLLDSLDGLDRFKARKRIVELMEGLGLLARIEPHAHTVPHGDRSGVPVEPWRTDQWYVNVKPLAERSLQAVRDGKTRFIPEQYEKTFFRWLEDIQPWCISRQLWWGHQIPVWYARKKVSDNPLGWASVRDDPEVFIARNEAEAIQLAKGRLGCEIRVLDAPPSDFTNDTHDPVFQQIINDEISRKPRWEPIWRDPDVLDTWFSSALWPFSTMGWPEQTPELARYYPNAALVTGPDIIFFWVARMMFAGLFTQGEVPFRDVYIHGLVRDEKGAKMSKSKGNVMDPLDVIDKFGADALRFALTAFATQGRDIKLSMQRIEGYRNFCTKLWNAARFAEMNGCARVKGFAAASAADTLSRWIIGELSKATREVTSAIEAYRFNDAANAAYRFVWNNFCDWYLELAKPVLQGADGAAKDEARAVTAHVLDQTVKLLHPFMPFITEELWADFGGRAGEAQQMLCLTAWPASTGPEAPEAEAEIGWVVDLVTAIRSARSEMNVPAASQIELVLVSAGEAARQRAGTWRDMLTRLARLSEISFADAVSAQSIQLIVRGETAALPLAGVIDIDAEKARLKKETIRLEGEIKRIDGKLGNADFVARAPEDVVEAERGKRDGYRERRLKMREALERLG